MPESEIHGHNIPVIASAKGVLPKNRTKKDEHPRIPSQTNLRILWC